MTKIKEQNGLTLLEVMVSMIILSIGILGLAPLINISIYGNSFSDDMTVANAMAQQEVEVLLNQSTYGDIPFYSSSDSVGGMFSIDRTVVDDVTDGTVPAGLYKITVDVLWTDKQDKPRTVQYSTFKSKI